MTKQCTQCANGLEEAAAVCIHCGAAVDRPAEWKAEPPFPPAPTPETPVEDTPVSPVPMLAPPASSTKNQPPGIGGWLILPAISLVVSPFQILRTLVTVDLPVLFGVNHQAYLDSHPANAALIVFEAASNVVFVATLILLNYLFFSRKKAFPTWMILYLALRVCVRLADHMAARALLPDADISKHAAS